MKRFLLAGIAFLLAVAVFYGPAVSGVRVENGSDPYGNIYIGSQRVMRLASDGMPAMSRAASVYRRLATLQGNYATFRNDRIVVALVPYDSRKPALAVPANATAAQINLRLKRQYGYALMVGYQRRLWESQFVNEATMETRYIWGWNTAPDYKIEGVFVPIVTVSRADVELHKSTAGDLAITWRNALREAFEAVKK